jgi:hypothetical protein
VAVVSSASGQDAVLRYKWVEGDEIRYRIELQSNATMSGLPTVGEMTVDQHSFQVIRLTVVSVAADGSATLRQTFESVRMEVSSPAGKTVFDSSAADAPANASKPSIATTMAALVGESITVVVLPNGTVTKVEGMSRLLDKMTNTLGQNPMAAQVAGQLRATMSDDAMRNVFEQGFPAFPERAVTPGDTWTRELTASVPILGMLTTTSTLTLKGIENSDGVALARMAVVIAMRQSQQASPSSPLPITAVFGDSKGEGEILFDLTRGRIQKTSLKTQMPATMSMPAPDGSQITVQGHFATTMTTQTVEK